MPSLSLQESVMISLNSLLQFVTKQKLGPTKTSPAVLAPGTRLAVYTGEPKLAVEFK